MSISENIRNLRERNGLTQEELGNIAGVSSMAVSQWENGRAVPRMGAIQLLADHFNISKGELIDQSPSYDYAVVSFPATDTRQSEINQCYSQMSEENKETLLKLARMMVKKVD